MITRGWPVLDIDGETQDHPHHKGLWFAYRKVNDEDFWLEPASEAHIRHIKTTKTEAKENTAQISTVSRWIDKDGCDLLEEKRDMIFTVATNQYTIDFDITLTALDKKVVFTDHKDGLFAIQLADWLRESTGTGKFLSSKRETSAETIWGKRRRWVRLQGQKPGKTIGIAILNHPSSFNFPTYWHVRDYGLVSANPLGQFIFESAGKNPRAQRCDLTLKPGQKVRFKFRVIIYEGPKTYEQLEECFRGFAETNSAKAPRT